MAPKVDTEEGLPVAVIWFKDNAAFHLGQRIVRRLNTAPACTLTYFPKEGVVRVVQPNKPGADLVPLAAIAQLTLQ